MKHTRARREPRHGSNTSTRGSRITRVRFNTQILAALVIAAVQLATAFVVDVSATWSQRSSIARTSTRRRSGYQSGDGSNSKMLCAMGPGQRKHSGRGTPPTSRRSAATRLRVAGEDQQQHQRQHLQQHDDPRQAGRAWGTSAVNDTTTATITASASHSSSSSSSGSSTVAKPPVLPVVGDIRRVNMDALRVRPRSPDGENESAGSFVELFRACAPYIRAHLGAVMVIHMGGELLEDPNFLNVMDDLGLLRLLGAKLVVITGARPQVSALLQQAGIKEEFRDDLRVTSKDTLKAIKAAAGFVRIEVESALSRGGGRGGTAGGFHVAGGNYFSAQPVGVRNGLDYGCTGEVRKVEADKIRSQLEDGGVVQLTCIGYSGSGEVFNVNTVDLAARCAAALGASKLVYIADGSHLEDTITGEIINSMRLSEARLLLSRYKKNRRDGATLPNGASRAVDLKDLSAPPVVAAEAGSGVFADEQASAAGGEAAGGDDAAALRLEQGLMRRVEKAVMALTEGVARAHVIPPTGGALLQELYTRDGAGLLISRDIYDGIRPANPADIPGIREITAPLEQRGVLVPRPPEQLEADILRNEFFVITRDDSVLGVAFFKRFGQDHAEVGSLAIHRDYRKRGWGEAMLSYLERVALASSVQHIFVLSTVTMQWFVERGFQESEVSGLPQERRDTYNWERRSKIYLKTLGGGARAVDAEELLWDVRGMV